MPLGQDCPYTNITRICVKNEREGVVRVSQNWGRGQLVFQQVKGMLAFFCLLEHSRFFCKTVEGFCNVGIVLYKPTVVICQPQELLDVAFGNWYWPRCKTPQPSYRKKSIGLCPRRFGSCQLRQYDARASALRQGFSTGQHTLSSWVNGLAYIQCVILNEVITVVVCILSYGQYNKVAMWKQSHLYSVRVT